MWRNAKSQVQSAKTGIRGGRWRLVVAVIFLLSGALVYRLFSLQIKESDIYTALAANQQQVSKKLSPERGNIYFTGQLGGQETLYPAATNKEFAVLFAVPKDIADPAALAEKFYEFFDKPQLLAAATASGTPAVIASSTKAAIIAGYLKHFAKPAAVYDSLDNRRVDTDSLLKLYAFLASSTSTPVSASDLDLKGNSVVYKDATSSATAVLQIPGLGFTIQELRYYPEGDLGSQLLGFVSYANGGAGVGKYGLEGFFNDELTGQFGSLNAARGAQGNLIIADDQNYVPPVNGDDLVLTVDRNVEYYACQALAAAVKKHGATGGSVVAVSPQTGAIIAMCSVPDFNPNDYQGVKNIDVYNNPALLYEYEPGSVFKTITMSAALDQGKVTPNTTYKDAGAVMIPGWPKLVKNFNYDTHGGYGITDMNTVMELSLNTGAIFAMQQIGPQIFTDYVRNYGFGQKTGVELGAEADGNISNIMGDHAPAINVATAAFGQGIAATPLQMVMSYQAIANGGVLMKPYIVKAIIHDGQRVDTIPTQVRRVISQKTAQTISGMLVNVVELGESKRAQIPGYYVGGKTGTAQIADKGGYMANHYIHTFVGIVPIDHPAFVMLTKIDDPKDVTYAEGSALPLWTDIAKFMLNYYQIPKSRPN